MIRLLLIVVLLASYLPSNEGSAELTSLARASYDRKFEFNIKSDTAILQRAVAVDHCSKGMVTRYKNDDLDINGIKAKGCKVLNVKASGLFTDAEMIAAGYSSTQLDTAKSILAQGFQDPFMSFSIGTAQDGKLSVRGNCQLDSTGGSANNDTDLNILVSDNQWHTVFVGWNYDQAGTMGLFLDNKHQPTVCNDDSGTTGVVSVVSSSESQLFLGSVKDFSWQMWMSHETSELPNVPPEFLHPSEFSSAPTIRLLAKDDPLDPILTYSSGNSGGVGSFKANPVNPDGTGGGGGGGKGPGQGMGSEGWTG